jgi:hypothetical protein
VRPVGEESPLAVAVNLAAAVAARTDLVYQLHELHSQQWLLEDVSRAPDATGNRVAAAKSAIDACNSRRHRLIDAIDASVRYTPSPAATRRYSETVGELCDRLLILDLKLVALGSTAPGVGDASPHAVLLRRVCAYLGLVVEQLIDDMAAGAALLPPRVGVKIYGQVSPRNGRAGRVPVAATGGGQAGGSRR